ncbi:unnamed protein product, partial [Nesidiocoris tenuis]
MNPFKETPSRLTPPAARTIQSAEQSRRTAGRPPVTRAFPPLARSSLSIIAQCEPAMSDRGRQSATLGRRGRSLDLL